MNNITAADAARHAAEAQLVDLDEDASLALLSGIPARATDSSGADGKPAGAPTDDKPNQNTEPKQTPTKATESVSDVTDVTADTADTADTDAEPEDALIFISPEGDLFDDKSKPKSDDSDDSDKSADVKTKHSPTSVEEQRRMWQSKYDHEREQRIRLEERLRALEERLAVEPDRVVSPVESKPPATEFTKTVTDFMPHGMEFVPYDVSDPMSPSGRAYAQYQEELRRHDRESLKREIEESLAQKSQQEKQRQFLERQLNVLREKTKMTDEQIRSFIEEVSQPDENALYLLYMAHSFKNGRIPLQRSALNRLLDAYKPNGDGRGSPMHTVPSGVPAAPVQVDPQIGVFSDYENASL